MPPATTYKCEYGHEFYSYAGTPMRTCAYGGCSGNVVAVTGPLAPKKERRK